MPTHNVPYAELTVSIQGTVSGEHLYDPLLRVNHGSIQTYRRLEYLLPDLAEGGYVIDLQPLASHPRLVAWVFASPLPNGRVEGEDIHRLSEESRQFAAEMSSVDFGLQGAFRDIAALVAKRVGEDPEGKEAGPLDYVSAAYRAAYWGSKGARIGQRRGDTLYWFDGTQQPIEEKKGRA